MLDAREMTFPTLFGTEPPVAQVRRIETIVAEELEAWLDLAGAVFLRRDNKTGV